MLFLKDSSPAKSGTTHQDNRDRRIPPRRISTKRLDRKGINLQAMNTSHEDTVSREANVVRTNHVTSTTQNG